MIDYIFGNEMHVWLLITAIIFTFVGRSQVKRNVRALCTGMVGETVESTIDSLIKDGYIKTRLDQNGEIELVKHYEEV